MKKVVVFLSLMLIAVACENQLTEPYDVGQKPATIRVKGYSSPDAVELRLNNEPVIIGDNSFYTENIETTVRFVVDKGETNLLGVYDHESGTALAEYPITYDNIEENSEIYFFNLPGIFLNTYAVRPQVNLGRVGFVFIFPNLGEFSGYQEETVKGVLKKANGTVLATFEEIGKENFTDVKIYNFFSATERVYLELYKPETTEPYTGTEIISVEIRQDSGANMIVLQEVSEGGTTTVIGEIDIADYL